MGVMEDMQQWTTGSNLSGLCLNDTHLPLYPVNHRVERLALLVDFSTLRGLKITFQKCILYPRRR